MHRSAASRGRSATVALCALLVLLPGICSAVASTIAPHGGSRLSPSADSAAENHRESTRTAHVHRDRRASAPAHHGGSAPAPSSDSAPAPGAEQCETHGCCLTAAKGEARQVMVASSGTIESVDIGVASRTLPAARLASTSLDEAPPGTPGLIASSPPLRR